VRGLCRSAANAPSSRSTTPKGRSLIGAGGCKLTKPLLPKSGAKRSTPCASNRVVQSTSGSSYGESFADVYDRWYGEISDATATAAFVAKRCGAGPVLELGVGTGRLVPALLAQGCAVIGIDASEAMLTRCRANQANRNAHLVQADLAALPLRPGVGVGAAVCAFNTLFNLPTKEAQANLFQAVGQALEPAGALVVEAITGADLVDGPRSSVGVSRMDRTELVLSATLLDAEDQTIQGQHVQITEAGIRMRPWLLRWTTPPQLDEMAEAAGLVLTERYADWDGAVFDEESTSHVSVYQLAKS